MTRLGEERRQVGPKAMSNEMADKDWRRLDHGKACGRRLERGAESSQGYIYTTGRARGSPQVSFRLSMTFKTNSPNIVLPPLRLSLWYGTLARRCVVRGRPRLWGATKYGPHSIC
jgi:hypothetical protein